MLEKWIVRHWLTLCIGCITMGIALRWQFESRGHMSFGAEWLIIPTVFAVEYVARLVRKEMRGTWKDIRRCGRTWKKMGTY